MKTTVKRVVLVLVVLLGGGLVTEQVALAQPPPFDTNRLYEVYQSMVAQEIPFDSNPNLLRMPAGQFLGEVAGGAVNSKGHIFVYSRVGSSSGHIIAPQARRCTSSGPTAPLFAA